MRGLPLRDERHRGDVAVGRPTFSARVRQQINGDPSRRGGGRFCVNVLRSFHSRLSQAFSGKLKGEDRFRVGAWRKTDDGLPFLGDAQANLFCEVDRITDYGTHTIFIGRVYSPIVHADVDSLLY